MCCKLIVEDTPHVQQRKIGSVAKMDPKEELQRIILWKHRSWERAQSTGRHESVQIREMIWDYHPEHSEYSEKFLEFWLVDGRWSMVDGR